MKTIVTSDNLAEERHVVTEGYEIGELTAKAVKKLGEERYLTLRAKELAGRFNGVRTFIDYISENEGKFGGRIPNRDYDSSHEVRGSSWTKFKTFEDCSNAIKKEPEQFRHFTEADIRLNEYASLGNDADYDVTGDFLDVGRVMAGEPECFGTMRNGSLTKRFANVVINGNHAHWIDQSFIDKKAQRVARLVDVLEVNNVRTKVTIVWSNKDSHLEIVVKQYDDRLDLNDVCVALSPDFFRRYEFWFSEHSATHESSYGRAEPLSLDMVKDEDVNVNILVNSNGHRNVDEGFDEVEKRISETDWNINTSNEYVVLG